MLALVELTAWYRSLYLAAVDAGIQLKVVESCGDSERPRASDHSIRCSTEHLTYLRVVIEGCRESAIEGYLHMEGIRS